MGNSQFYSPIKTSVDSIQTATTQIQTATTQIQTTVDTLKNTDVANVSSAMLEKKKARSSLVLGNHYANTVIDIAGAGILVSISNINTSTNEWGCIEVDNNGIFMGVSIPAMCNSIFMYRFNSRLKITRSNVTNQYEFYYLLD